MGEHDAQGRPLALLGEHALLGARLAVDDNAVPVLGYAASGNGAHGETGGVCLADLSRMDVWRVGGPPAQDFVRIACAAAPLETFGCAPSAVLAGDGALVGVPLVARTGDDEYALLDLTPRAPSLGPWLGFLSSVSQGGRAPFSALEIEDASDVHVPLLLLGDGAACVLADYLDDASDLPTEGSVSSVALDGRMRALVLRVPAVGTDCLLVLAHPAHAVALWRSLLSFPEVDPIGRDSLFALLSRLLPWFSHTLETDRTMMYEAELAVSHLARRAHDYVGGRALSTSGGDRR